MSELSKSAVMQRGTTSPTSAAACTTASDADVQAPTPTASTASTASKLSPKGKKENDKTRGARGRVPFDERAVTSGGFFVAGAWSKAGVCSCFNIRHRHLLGKHGVVFDMGVCPSEVRSRYHTTVRRFLRPFVRPSDRDSWRELTRRDRRYGKSRSAGHLLF